MLDEHLDALNAQLDRTALLKRLSIEGEHLKRIKCTKVLRIYTRLTDDWLRINTRIIADCSTDNKTQLWDLVQRVVVSFNTDIPSVDQELALEGISLEEPAAEEDVRVSADSAPKPAEAAESTSHLANFARLNDGESKGSIASDVYTKTLNGRNTDELRGSEADDRMDMNRAQPTTTNDSKANVQAEATHETKDESFRHQNDPEDIEVFEWDSSCKAEAFMVPLQKSYRKIQLLIKLRNDRGVKKLSKKLRNLFGKYSDTPQNVVKDLYKYINLNRLNDYATGNVKCNKELSEIFGVEEFNFRDVAALLEVQLEPIGYCTINLSKECETWDIVMDADDLAHMPLLYPKNVQLMEKKIAAVTESKKRLEERIALLEDFVLDPVNFVNRKIALESEGLGTQSSFYDVLSVQTAVYELIKKYESAGSKEENGERNSTERP